MLADTPTTLHDLRITLEGQKQALHDTLMRLRPAELTANEFEIAVLLANEFA